MAEKLKDKYVFFDVDGTLAEYRFRDKIYEGGTPELGCVTLHDVLFTDIFLNSRPLKTMQRLVSQLDEDKIFILGTVISNTEVEQKYIWLETHFPQFKKENIILISSTMMKPEVMIEYSKHFNWNLDEIAFIDDRLDVLRKAEELGIKSYHPSSFIE